jgi:hypothetical protein
VEAPIIISKDDARQGPTDHKVLYVLGFGIAGAILANMTVFLYSLRSTRQAENQTLPRYGAQ